MYLRTTAAVDFKRFLIRVMPVIFIFAVCCLPGFTGCSTDKPAVVNDEDKLTQKAVELEKISVLVVGNEKLGPAIKRQWAARRDGQLEIVNQTLREFESDDYTLGDQIDVVIYPPAFIGELVVRSQIAEVPDSVWSDTELLNNKEMLRHARTTCVRIGRATWAVPLGSPQLTMLFRRDVLDALGSSVPKTWEEFDRLVEQLHDSQTLQDESGNELPTGIGLPLRQEWAAQAFLARVAASVRSRGKLSILFDRKTMEPLIDSPPFVQSLTQLKLIAKGRDTATWKTAAEVYREMVEGRLAIALTWPSAHFTDNENGTGFDETKVIDAIEIARIPGSNLCYDRADEGWSERDKLDSVHVDLVGFEGFIASINRKSGHSLTAYEFLKWLPSKSISLTTMTEATTSGPFRASHLGNPADWTGNAISPDAAHQYADIIEQINQDNIALVFPRIPGYSRYLRALNEAIQKCLAGELEPQAALNEAANQWREITNQLDLNQQLANLRREQGS